MGSIPAKYQNLEGLFVVFSESELRLAIAIAEAIKVNTSSGGSDALRNLAVSNAQLTLISANTEYSITLSAAIRYSFKILSGGSVRFSNVSGRVAAPTLPYYTLDTSSEEFQDFGDSYKFSGTLYFASSTSNTIIVFQIWT